MSKEKTPYPAIVEKNTGNSQANILYQSRYKFYNTEQISEMRRTLPELLRILGVENPENGRPFHCLHPDHDDHNPSMSYWAEKNAVHCHSCGVTGDAFDVAGWQEGIVGKDNFLGKIKALENLLGRSFGEPAGNGYFSHRQAKQKPKPDPYPTPEMMPNDSVDLWANGSVWKAYNALFEPEGLPARQYLVRRGMDSYEASRFGIGWCKHPSEIIPACKNFRQSTNGWLVFPFFDADRNSVFYCTFRNLSDSSTKEMKPPRGDGKYPSLLFREHLLNKSDITVHVTESVLDAISYSSLFGCSTIGLNGKSGIRRLLGIVHHSTVRPRKFVLALDNDDAGHSMVADLENGLTSIGVPCEIVNPYEKITDADIKDANALLQYVRKRGDHD